MSNSIYIGCCMALLCIASISVLNISLDLKAPIINGIDYHAPVYGNLWELY